MTKIYFAHPVNVYGTEIEKQGLELLEVVFPGQEIENPNQPHHQKGYAEWSKRQKEKDTHKGMNYFFEEVLPSCAGCAAMPFLDMRFGLGVVGEAKWFLERKLPVWIILPSVSLVRQITAKEIEMILSYDPNLVVPHEETRLRTWKIYNQIMRPYEEAHLVKMPVPEGFYPDK